MAKYILSKLQIKRLLDGNYVVDGHGRKLIADDKTKDVLRELDELNLYDKFDAIIENGKFDVVKKECK